MMKAMWATMMVLAGLMTVTGCGDKMADKGGDKQGAEVAKGGTGSTHQEWWCDEHGVKEVECSMCSPAVFKKLKPADICPKHPDRAKAQCFICNPELWPKSAAVYTAKYGKEPPEPVNNMPEKK